MAFTSGVGDLRVFYLHVLIMTHSGADWEKAKTQTECLDYLFEVAVKMKQMGLPVVLEQATNGLETPPASRKGKYSMEVSLLQMCMTSANTFGDRMPFTYVHTPH